MLATCLRGFRIRVTHVDDKELQTLIVTIVLVARTLIALVGVALQIVVRKLSFDPFANLDDGELGRALKHGTGDQIAHAIGEALRRWTDDQPRARWS